MAASARKTIPMSRQSRAAWAAAVIVLALGLLLLWIFVWFIGGAIGGLIRNVLELGRKWCYEEVPV